MKFEKIIDGLTDEIEFMIGMGTAPLVQEAARRELQSQQQEIAELKQLAETKNARTLERIGRIERQEREISELKAKLQSVKADAVKEFGHEIGLYDSEYDDQEYIEVSRYSLREHIEQLREGKS